jgi:hypothetical protein
MIPQATPGVRTSAAAKVTEVIVRQADGTAASIGSSVGFWPEVNDFVTTVDARFGRPGFPRSWPDVYSSSKALRRLLGKKGLQGAMSKTVDLLSKVYIFTLSRSPRPTTHGPTALSMYTQPRPKPEPPQQLAIHRWDPLQRSHEAALGVRDQLPTLNTRPQSLSTPVLHETLRHRLP